MPPKFLSKHKTVVPEAQRANSSQTKVVVVTDLKGKKHFKVVFTEAPASEQYRLDLRARLFDRRKYFERKAKEITISKLDQVKS